MSETTDKIYSLRGYDGKLPRGEIKLIKRKTDFIVIFAGLIILIGVVIPWNI